jgi:hypothetical protein
MVFNGCCLGRKKKEEAAGDRALERMLASEPQLPRFSFNRFPVFKRFWQKPGHPATAWDLTLAVFEYAQQLYKQKPNRKTGDFGLVRRYIFEDTRIFVGTELAAELGYPNSEVMQTRKQFNDHLICKYRF